ncbi:MAG: OmpA family protein [Rhodosalinus sp.]
MPITRRRAEAALAGLFLLVAGPVPAAVELDLPAGAGLAAEEQSARDSHLVPAGPWSAEDGVPGLRAEGTVTRRVWRFDGPGRTTLQLIAPLREQLRAQGFEVLFECRDRACGGFDFRFEIEVLPAPAMYVDLTRYRFLSALRVRGDGAADHVTLLASRTDRAGYLQLVHVASGGAAPLETRAPAAQTAAPALPLAEALEARGHAVLEGLDFASGSSELSDRVYPVLEALAAYLVADESRVVVLVGHTDAVGALDGNVALSRARAEAVLRRLVERHGVPPAQLRAEGVGYLAPVATNLTAAGREVNRRVEAVLASAD